MTPPRADSREGMIEGIYTDAANRNRIAVFSGIPFAAAPLGSLRYRRPAEPPLRHDTLTALQVGAAPIQPRVLGVGMRGAELTSEDCLTLNVFTPATDDAHRPVMVWLFGGGYINGHGGDGLYDGSCLAAQENVVVVTLNYRLGALGFARLNDSNCGLADQIAALRWLSVNVGAFGGDSNNITLFGESAGGMSISNLLAAPTARGLFHRAIIQSGSAENVATRSQAEETAARFTEEYDQARGPFIDRILEAQRMTTLALRPVHRATPFRPHLDDDLLPRAPLEAACPDVPLIIGTTAHEQRLYVRPRQRISDDNLVAYVTRRLALTAPDPQAAALAAITHYRQRPDEPTSNAAVLADIDTELRFRRAAQRYVDARGGNTWVYRFDWPSPAMRGWLGACHAIDVPFAFGNINLPGTNKFVGTGAPAATLANEVMHRWANFARDGHPGDNWPVYDPVTRQRFHFGETTTVTSINDDPDVAMWDALFGA